MSHIVSKIQKLLTEEFQAEEDNLTCPISKALFVNPYIASDGFTYSKSSLDSCIHSPVTRDPNFSAKRHDKHKADRVSYYFHNVLTLLIDIMAFMSSQSAQLSTMHGLRDLCIESAHKLKEWMDLHGEASKEDADTFRLIWENIKQIPNVGSEFVAYEQKMRQERPKFMQSQHDDDIAMPQKKIRPESLLQSGSSMLGNSISAHSSPSSARSPSSVVPTFVSQHRTFWTFFSQELTPVPLMLTYGSESMRFVFPSPTLLFQTRVKYAAPKPEVEQYTEKTHDKCVHFFKDMFYHETGVKWENRFTSSVWRLPQDAKHQGVRFVYASNLRTEAQVLFGYALSKSLQRISDPHMEVAIETMSERTGARVVKLENKARFLLCSEDVRGAVNFSPQGSNSIFPTIASISQDILLDERGALPAQRVIFFTDCHDQSNMTTENVCTHLNNCELHCRGASEKLQFHVVHLGNAEDAEPSLSLIPHFLDSKNLFHYHVAKDERELDNVLNEILGVSQPEQLMHSFMNRLPARSIQMNQGKSSFAQPVQNVALESNSSIWVPDTNIISSNSAIQAIQRAIESGDLLSGKMKLGISYTVLCELDRAKHLRPIRSFAHIVNDAHLQSPQYIHQESKTDFDQEMECKDIAQPDDRILRFCDCLKTKYKYKRVVLCTNDTMLANKVRSFDVEVCGMDDWVKKYGW